MEIITRGDLPESMRNTEGIDLLLAGLNARAVRIAPCLAGAPDTGLVAEAKLILLSILKRWVEAGASGAWTRQAVGPFSVSMDTRQGDSGWTFRPSDISELQALCSTGIEGKAFAISLTGRPDYCGSPYDHWVGV